MKKKIIQIQSIFPVELMFYEDGKVILKDFRCDLYEIKNKDGSALSQAQFQRIVDQQLGFWKIVKRFQLIVVKDEGKA